MYKKLKVRETHKKMRESVFFSKTNLNTDENALLVSFRLKVISFWLLIVREVT